MVKNSLLVFSTLMIILLGFNSCFSKRKSIGLINLTSNELRIITNPIISYYGHPGFPEKGISFINPDCISWHYWNYGINARILKPATKDSSWIHYFQKGYCGQIGEYVMRPSSSFELNSLYFSETFSSENINISYLRIYLQNGDSIEAKNKDEIWRLCQKNKRNKYNKSGKMKKIFKEFKYVLVIE